MQGGEGMVAVVQGLRDAGLAVTVVNRNYLQNALKKDSRRRVSANQSTAETNTDHVVENNATQLCDRYANIYQTYGNTSLPNAPVKQHPEFPLQKAEPSRVTGNFQLSGGAVENTNDSKVVPPQTCTGAPLRPYSRGSVFSVGSSSQRESDAFIQSLRRYPLPMNSVSSELVQRLLNYTETKHFSRKDSVSLRSLRYKSFHRNKESKESKGSRESNEWKGRESRAKRIKEAKESIGAAAARKILDYKRFKAHRTYRSDRVFSLGRAVSGCKGIRESDEEKENSDSFVLTDPKKSQDIKQYLSNVKVKCNKYKEPAYLSELREIRRLREIIRRESKHSRRYRRSASRNDDSRKETTYPNGDKEVDESLDTEEESNEEITSRNRRTRKTSLDVKEEPRDYNKRNRKYKEPIDSAEMCDEELADARDSIESKGESRSRQFRDQTRTKLSRRRLSDSRRFPKTNESRKCMQSREYREDSDIRDSDSDVKVNKFMQTYTKTSNEVLLARAGKGKVARTSGDRRYKGQLRETYNYLKAADRGRQGYTGQDQEIRYLHDVTRCVRDAIQQILQPPVVCPTMQDRYLQHRRQHHHDDAAAADTDAEEAVCPIMQDRYSQHRREHHHAAVEETSPEERSSITHPSTSRDVSVSFRCRPPLGTHRTCIFMPPIPPCPCQALNQKSLNQHTGTPDLQAVHKDTSDVVLATSDVKIVNPKSLNRITGTSNLQDVHKDTSDVVLATSDVKIVNPKSLNRITGTSDLQDAHKDTSDVVLATSDVKIVNPKSLNRITGTSDLQDAHKDTSDVVLATSDVKIVIPKSLNRITGTSDLQDAHKDTSDVVLATSDVKKVHPVSLNQNNGTSDLEDIHEDTSDVDLGTSDVEIVPKGKSYESIESSDLEEDDTSNGESIKSSVDQSSVSMHTDEELAAIIDKIGDDIYEHLNDFAVIADDSPEMADKCNAIMKEMVSELKKIQGEKDFPEKAKKVVVKHIGMLPMWFPGKKEDEPKLIDEMAENILTNLHINENTFRRPSFLVRKAKILKRINDKKKIIQWLNDIPTLKEDTQEVKTNKKKLASQIAFDINNVEDWKENIEEVRNEIKKYLDTIPIWLPVSNLDQKKFKNQLIDNLLDKLNMCIQDIIEPSNKTIEENIIQFVNDLPIPAKDLPETKTKIDEIVKQLVATVKRYQNHDDYESKIKENIKKAMNILQVHFPGSRNSTEILKKQLADNLVKKLNGDELGNHEKIRKEVDKDIEKWLNKAPIYAENTPKVEIQKKKLAQTLAKQLRDLKDRSGVNKKAKKTITKELDKLPLELPIAKQNQEKLKRQLADNLLYNILSPEESKILANEIVEACVRDCLKKLSGFTNAHEANKVEMEEVVQDLIKMLKGLEGHPSYKEKTVNEIQNRIESLIKKGSGNIRNQEIDAQQLAEYLVKTILIMKNFETSCIIAIEEEIRDWLKKLPITSDDNLETSAKKEKVVKDLAQKLKRLKGRGDYKDKANETIKKTINALPLDLPGSKQNQEKVKKQLAESLLLNINNKEARMSTPVPNSFNPESSKTNGALNSKDRDSIDQKVDKDVRDWFETLPVFTEDIPSNEAKRESIIRKFAVKIKLLKDREDYKEKVAAEIKNLINNLPLQLSGSNSYQEIVKNELSDKLLRNILDSVQPNGVEKKPFYRRRTRSYPDDNLVEEQIFKWLEEVPITDEDQGIIGKQILQWLHKLPVFQNVDEECRTQISEIVKDLASKLQNIINKEDYESIAKDVIKDYIDMLPMFFPGTNQDREKSKNWLAEKLLRLIHEERLNFIKKVVIDWLNETNVLNDTESSGEKVNKEKIADKFAATLLPIMTKSINVIKEIVIDFIKNLPIKEIKDNKKQAIDEIANKLIRRLKPGAEIEEEEISDSEFEEKIWNWLENATVVSKETKRKKRNLVKQFIKKIIDMQSQDDSEDATNREIDSFLKSLLTEEIELSSRQKREFTKMILKEINNMNILSHKKDAKLPEKQSENVAGEIISRVNGMDFPVKSRRDTITELELRDNIKEAVDTILDYFDIPSENINDVKKRIAEILYDQIVHDVDDATTENKIMSVLINAHINEKDIKPLIRSLMKRNREIAVCYRSPDKKFQSLMKTPRFLLSLMERRIFEEKAEKEILNFVGEITGNDSAEVRNKRKPDAINLAAKVALLMADPNEVAREDKIMREISEYINLPSIKTNEDKQKLGQKLRERLRNIDYTAPIETRLKTSTPQKDKVSLIPHRFSGDSDITAIDFNEDEDNRSKTHQTKSETQVHDEPLPLHDEPLPLHDEPLDYYESVIHAIKMWMNEIGLKVNIPNEQELKNSICKDIAGDVIDRQKYFESTDTSKKEDIDHLKYLIFRSLNKVLDPKYLSKIVSTAHILMEKINALLTPQLVDPYIVHQSLLSEQAPMVTQDSEPLEEAILAWLKQQPFYQERSLEDKKIQESLVSELANTIKTKIMKSQTELVEDIDGLLIMEIVKQLREFPMDFIYKSMYVYDLAKRLHDHLKKLQLIPDIYQHELSDSYINDAIAKWSKPLVSKRDFYSRPVIKAKHKLASAIKKIPQISPTEEASIKHVTNDIEDLTAQFLRKIPLYSNKMYDTKALSDSLLILLKKYSKQPRISLIDPQIKKATDFLEIIIAEWCANLLIQADTPKEADKIRQRIADALTKELEEFNNDPDIFYDDSLYDEMLDNVIEETLDNLDLDFQITFPLKKTLAEKAKEARLKALQRPNNKPVEIEEQGYKQDLCRTISEIIPHDFLPPHEPESFELLKDEIAEAFINLHYIGGNRESLNLLKNKIRDEIDKFFNKHLNKHSSTPFDLQNLNKDLYSALKNVPIPDKESFIKDAEMIKIKNEIRNWIKDLPIEKQTDAEKLETSKIISELAKEILEIVTQKDDVDDYDEVLQSKILKALEKIPQLGINRHEDLKKAARKLNNTLNDTMDSRKLESSIPTTQDLPPTAISTEDQAHLQRIRERSSLGLRASSPSTYFQPPSADTSSQTEIQCLGPGVCQGPKTCKGKAKLSSGVQTPSQRMQAVGSQIALSPQVIIKEYYWDSLDSAMTAPQDPCTFSRCTMTEPIQSHRSIPCSPSPRRFICESQPPYLPCHSDPSPSQVTCTRSMSAHKNVSQQTGQYSTRCRSPCADIIADNMQRPGPTTIPCSYRPEGQSSVSQITPQNQIPSSSRRTLYTSQELISAEDAEPSCSFRKTRVTHLGSFDHMDPKSSKSQDSSWEYPDHTEFWEDNRRCLISKNVAELSLLDRLKKEEKARCRCKERTAYKCSGRRGSKGSSPRRSRSPNRNPMSNCSKCRGEHCPYPSYMFFR